MATEISHVLAGTLLIVVCDRYDAAGQLDRDIIVIS